MYVNIKYVLMGNTGMCVMCSSSGHFDEPEVRCVELIKCSCVGTCTRPS